MSDPDRRDPEAFLRQATQEGRGRLKIFLGAAPGVGKTYEMLTDGMQRLRAGIDVVVGIVETHGRKETEALLIGHEVIPRRAVEHKGHRLGEMDIDAILARRPQLVLVDELAHSNAPGSRHPKRYQDVEELLDAGIDVYSTVNIQHVESLNDVVASFTRVHVRETVPDSILEMAEIEVVDIPPDELIERLKEGKVYIPQEASRALNHFFSKSNLAALREMALRRAAQAVDAQMLDYVRAHALAGSFAAGERVLVAISEVTSAQGLVRAAKRLADALKAPWSAVHIETQRSLSFTPKEREQLADTMALASRLGATTATIPATSVVEGLKDYVADARATQIVIGKSARPWWFELRHGSVVDKLVREIGDVAVHVLPGDAATPGPQAVRQRFSQGWGKPSHYLWSAVMIAAMTALGRLLIEAIDLSNIALMYLVPVMFAAASYGLRAGLVSGLLSSLAYNFFFLPPTGTLTVNNPENVVSILVLLGVAIVTSQFAARVRAQADLAQSSARQNAALAGFSRQITASASQEELMHAICAEVGRLLQLRTVLLLPSPDGPQLRAAVPPEDRLEQIEKAAAQWAMDNEQPAGRGSSTLTASDWLFHPLRTQRGVLGVLGLAREDAGPPLRSDQVPLLMSLLDQASIAFDRMALEQEMLDARQIKERDRLRAALLSSVSHDLRTPLTTILSAVHELKRQHPSDLLDTVDAEAQRLNRFVANLLDMARVEAGALPLKVEPTDLFDAVAGAVHDTRQSLQGHAVEVEIAPDIPLVRVDPTLLHHCLINLLDNAGRYAHPGTPVIVRGQRLPDAIALSVVDEGPGIPAGAEARVFDTFTRLEGSDRAKHGTGLGLAIVKGFAEAMGLTVSAANNAEPRGAAFTIMIPQALIISDVPHEDLL
ncbi:MULTISPECIES: sensor histidine kinase [unclassified Sphingobium]|uniref:sensor histidine kinase n=1 Tax=unclassified Sphingobium TaxID=2611147 RepID=UPI002224BB47|nr:MULTISPECIES: sensor histidine kinase KdpD [unclassified Sphingobium]MCW2380539.1 two-component system sensor histidine kinase KdpD [Sphingobium sp. B2D3B]MCW2399354.1 two-component system sensor histidine kinase KdpD [Sphingobium sp. B2D3C]